MKSEQMLIPGLEAKKAMTNTRCKRHPSTHHEDRIQHLEERVTLLEAENARLVTLLEYGGEDHAS